MTNSLKELLEKYNPDTIFKTLEENYDPSAIRPGSFVVINPEALRSKALVQPILMRKGEGYIAQLNKLATEKQVLYVSALKSLRTTSGYLSEAPSSHAEEADLVIHSVPGLYTSPITVPVALLKLDTAPGDIMQKPIDDKYVAKNKTNGKGVTGPDEYNKGKQPKGTRVNGGNN